MVREKEIYCKELAYTVTGAGEANLISLGQAVRKDTLESPLQEMTLQFTGGISSSSGKPVLLRQPFN